MNYIIHCNEEIDTDVLVDKINNSLPLKEQKEKHLNHLHQKIF